MKRDRGGRERWSFFRFLSLVPKLSLHSSIYLSASLDPKVCSPKGNRGTYTGIRDRTDLLRLDQS